MSEPLVLGRYLICDEIGGGGMARVHLGRVLGAAGFSRVVAIKRLHPANADDVQYATMLLDEARLVARIRHPNVVPTLDVEKLGGEVILVMDYVHGPSLAWLRRNLAKRGERIPMPIVVRIVLDVLAGLHAAHQAKSERGRPLEMVHRDVSPHNVLISDDGAARLADFGIAKAEGKMSLTHHGEVKGKLSYMAPEQLRGEEVDRRADIFATGIVLWELLTGRDLFAVPPDGFVAGAVQKILAAKVEPPSKLVASSAELDAVVLKALRADRAERFTTAEAMSTALEAASPPATPKEVAAWIAAVAGDLLEKRARLVAQVEQTSAIHETTALAPNDAGRHGAARVSDRVRGVEGGPRELERAPREPEPVPREERARRRKRTAVLLAVALILASAALVLVIQQRYGARREAAAQVPTGAVVSSTSAILPSAHAVAAAAVAAADDDAAAASVSTLPPPPATSSPPAPVTPSSAARRHAPTKVAPPDCDPPYSIDPQGVRIPRRECLDR